MAFQPEDPSVEGICNQALVHLGVRGAFLDDLSADGTEEAEIFNAIYDHTRTSCLAAFPWPFATLRATLNQIPAEPMRDGFQYVYALPAGCIQTRKIWPSGAAQTLADLFGRQVTANDLRRPRSDQRIPFLIEKSSVDDGQVVLCDLVSPVLFYTADVLDVSKYPHLFVDALSWLLAAEAAIAITGKESRVKLCNDQALAAIHAAQVAALNGQQEDPEPTTESIAARD